MMTPFEWFLLGFIVASALTIRAEAPSSVGSWVPTLCVTLVLMGWAIFPFVVLTRVILVLWGLM